MKHLITTFLLLFTLLAAPAVQAHEMPGLPAGVQAPDFIGTDFRGDRIQLSRLYADGPVVLVFYRGSWCPYCNIHLQQIQAQLEDIKKFNATVVAVSVDKVDKAAKGVDGNDLDFYVISNPKGDILEKYRLTYVVPEALNKKYLDEYNIDLEAASGRTDRMIAIPGTYVIDTTGNIAFAYADENYKMRTSPREIISELRKLKMATQNLIQ